MDKQEPVAWITRRTGDGGVYVDGYETCESTDYGAIPVYTAPPSIEAAVLAEREACAKLCLEEAPSLDGQLCAEAIRARGEK